MAKGPKTVCHVIALGNSKGGCGKTSLTAALGVEAAKTSKAVLIDADPQQSLAQWHRRRRKSGVEGYPGLLRSGNEPIAEKVALLRHGGAEWIFIDLPPGDLDLLDAGIAAADFVVVPFRVSAMDVEATGPVVEICTDYVRPYGLVINEYEPTWKISASAAPYCAARNLPLLKSTVGHRQAYSGAWPAGFTGPEYDDVRQARVCAAEIKALWDEIKSLV